MQDVFLTAIVMYAIYMVLKTFTDFLLKRKVIKSGHFEKASILTQAQESSEENKYPTLKWGLVALFAGLGLIIIDVLNLQTSFSHNNMNNAFFPFGIELVSISIGFLLYFLIVSIKNKNE